MPRVPQSCGPQQLVLATDRRARQRLPDSAWFVGAPSPAAAGGTAAAASSSPSRPTSFSRSLGRWRRCASDTRLSSSARRHGHETSRYAALSVVTATSYQLLSNVKKKNLFVPR